MGSGIPTSLNGREQTRGNSGGYAYAEVPNLHPKKAMVRVLWDYNSLVHWINKDRKQESQ